MPSNLIQEFQSSLPADSSLLVLDVLSGQPISEHEVMALAAHARTLFVLSTSACREFDHIRQCSELWTETAAIFENLCSSWSDIKTDDPQIGWLKAELARCRELAADRCELYDVTRNERLIYAQNKGYDGEGKTAVNEMTPEQTPAEKLLNSVDAALARRETRIKARA